LPEQPNARGWRLVLARRASARAAVPASVRRFARRARRRRLRSALPWLVVLLMLVFAGIGAGLVYGTSLFGVGTVRVEGTVDVSTDEVRLAAAVRPGAPLASLDLAEVERRVEAYPPIQKATVDRSWPRTLVVRVWERSPVATVPLAGSYALLSADGVAYRQVGARPEGLPVVRVPDPGPGDETTLAALTVLAALPPALRDPLVALVADAPTRIRLELSDQRVVVWGDATANAEKARVASSVLAGPDGGAAKTVDVSAPSVVTVR
jgi:cell division protein FtsQ